MNNELYWKDDYIPRKKKKKKTQLIIFLSQKNMEEYEQTSSQVSVFLDPFEVF